LERPRYRALANRARCGAHEPLVRVVPRAGTERGEHGRGNRLDARAEFARVRRKLGGVPVENPEACIAQQRAHGAPRVETQMGWVEQALATVFETVVEEPGDDRS